ncbi:zinc finger MYM-type protein 1 isoform X2 [Bombina bombina]|uniref:zinc finger MYM-type protein 1 isoform X2 n=1 Tax=Bombina bombina TaxID=8345 RepID=UPI00235A777B|nr:zinc finger MYM-type protein 1 isoform X2 [Bombina bombina]
MDVMPSDDSAVGRGGKPDVCDQVKTVEDQVPMNTVTGLRDVMPSDDSAVGHGGKPDVCDQVKTLEDQVPMNTVTGRMDVTPSDSSAVEHGEPDVGDKVKTVEHQVPMNMATGRMDVTPSDSSAVEHGEPDVGDKVKTVEHQVPMNMATGLMDVMPSDDSAVGHGGKPDVCDQVKTVEDQVPMNTVTGLMDVTPSDDSAVGHGGKPDVCDQVKTVEDQVPMNTATGLMDVTPSDDSAVGHGGKPDVCDQVKTVEDQVPMNTATGLRDVMPSDDSAVGHGGKPDVCDQVKTVEDQVPMNTVTGLMDVTPSDDSAVGHGGKPDVCDQVKTVEDQVPMNTVTGRMDVTPSDSSAFEHGEPDVGDKVKTVEHQVPINTATGRMDVTPSDSSAFEHGEPDVGDKVKTVEHQVPINTATGLMDVTPSDDSAVGHGGKPDVCDQVKAVEDQVPMNTVTGLMDVTPSGDSAVGHGGKPDVCDQVKTVEDQVPMNTVTGVGPPAVSSAEKSSSGNKRLLRSTASEMPAASASSSKQKRCPASNLPAGNAISNLRNFSKLNFQSKQMVINNGRPMPELKDLLQMDGQKKITRVFQPEWYQRKEWLCGCATKKRLYCFSCILFSTTENVWTNLGFGDLKNLSRSLNNHEKSTTHIHCQIALKTFGSTLDQSLNENERRLDISNHNAKVRENRDILKHIIKAICYLVKQDIAFWGNEEGAILRNRGNFVELLYFFAQEDEILARHLETSTLYSGLTNRIQINVIEAIAGVIKDDIKTEINAAPYVAVEVDETRDVAYDAQISVVLRYVVKSEGACEVKEAFLGFDEVSDRRAPAISNYVLGVLEKYNCIEKLVAQTYDGASVMASDLNAVQAKIKEKVPEATFMHGYAHNLNLVLSHSAKCMPECELFFNTIEGLATTFTKSTELTQQLDVVVKRRLPRAAPIRWSSNSRLVHTVNKYQTDLRSMFHNISEGLGVWDGETMMKAYGYYIFLSKALTCFLLMAYEGIFTETDALFRVLQSKIMDVEFCRGQIRKTIGFLEHQRQEFDSFYELFEQKCLILGLTDKEISKEPIKNVRRRMYYTILDNVRVQMKARFDHFGQLSFLSLVDCTKLSEMSQHLDDAKLRGLSKYARHFDLVRLKADLIGLYSSEIVRNECKSAGQLLNFLVQTDLMQAVPEAAKLLQLVLTIPATTASVENSFSALKRIKKYSQKRTYKGQLSSLAFVIIEKERLLKLKEKREDFYNKVIDIFAQKDSQMDLIYK